MALNITENSVGEVTWSAPSNIALVKYWGKEGVQIPKNPNISFTLNESRTTTTVNYRPRKEGEENFIFFFEGKRKPSFEEKLQSFFERIESQLPVIKEMYLEIHSSNTFPHSAGIASSASAMSALALCLVEMSNSILSEGNKREFNELSSEIARLGSGSACRSVYGDLVIWGETEGHTYTSNNFGVSLESAVHEDFLNFNDHILIVSSDEKEVSSTVGHGLMNSNDFSETRFAQARKHQVELIQAMKEGNMDEFIRIVELEALTLHALMMTSNPSFMLMKPGTVAIIEKIRNYRLKTGTPICFTLDAGPNVHVLFPQTHAEECEKFIQQELVPLAEDGRVIKDKVGKGPRKLEVHASRN